ncbi:hypothetical protein ACOACO_00410 [Nocardioides sp. CPCC 205120]|uniref:hypothetical protein n=1 Tax=Nocardioides sp. CPCC 205120 TaxID=3406462 RepID=UPI003B503FD6
MTWTPAQSLVAAPGGWELAFVAFVLSVLALMLLGVLAFLRGVVRRAVRKEIARMQRDGLLPSGAADRYGFPGG